MGYHLNRLDKLVFIAVSKPLETGFGIHHRLESCESGLSLVHLCINTQPTAVSEPLMALTVGGGGGDVVDASSCDSSRSRWVCEVCTFENVRASVKCSMCRNPRTIKPGGGGGVGSPHQQHQQQPAVTSAADIFKLGSGKSPPPPPLHQVGGKT